MRAALLGLILLALPAAAHAHLANAGDAASFQASLVKIVAFKFPHFTPLQRESFATEVTRFIDRHSARFDKPLLDRFLVEYLDVPPMLTLFPDRARTDDEYEIELLLTKKKVDLFLEKTAMSAETRAEVQRQVRALSAFTDAQLAVWFGGLHDPLFAELFATVREGRYAGLDPFTDLVRDQTNALHELAGSYLQFAFRRPLTAVELQTLERDWVNSVRKVLDPRELTRKASEWRARLRSKPSQRDKEMVFDDIMWETRGGRISIGAMVKTLMEYPPTQDELRLRQAIRR